nr:hypothetical protein [Nocardioides sp. KC13]
MPEQRVEPNLIVMIGVFLARLEVDNRDISIVYHQQVDAPGQPQRV